MVDEKKIIKFITWLQFFFSNIELIYSCYLLHVMSPNEFKSRQLCCEAVACIKTLYIEYEYLGYECAVKVLVMPILSFGDKLPIYVDVSFFDDNGLFI